MDRNLKHILDSVTYLEWPGTDPEYPEKEASFWKRLELSMPKKRTATDELIELVGYDTCHGMVSLPDQTTIT